MSKKHRSSVSKDSSIIIPQRDKLPNALSLKDIQWTAKQQELINLILDKKTQIIFIDGLAGTAKTFISVYCGLKMLSDKKVSDFLYIRSVVESASKSLGYLPGESEDKFKPFATPLDDKLQELLNNGDVNKLYNEKRIRPLPYNYLRGCNWNAMFILADEAQNATTQELVTLITRIGHFSKMIVCGDSKQSDLNGKSGFTKIFNMFNSEESRNRGIHCVTLGIEDVMRSGIVRYILETLIKNNINNH